MRPERGPDYRHHDTPHTMGGVSKIEWTERTWNPVTGCSKQSAGCLHCYAETMSRRLCAMGIPKYKNGFKCTTHPECLSEPYKWKKSSTVFVCSMSDLFHEDVPFAFVDEIMRVIEETPVHVYQLLTKRAGRMKEYFESHPVPKNVWIGVTVENEEAKHRIDLIRDIPAQVRFLSCEPLVGELGVLDLDGIGWIIAGGESGPSARPMKKSWVLGIQKQAESYGIPFFFKQWGTWGNDGIKRSKGRNGKLLDGRTVQEKPVF